MQPILLSTDGSDRGTAYDMSNKIIRQKDKLFVGWLNAPEIAGQKAKIMLGVCNPETGHLMKNLELGQAEDNHCGPAIAIDNTGRLHVIIGSHGQHHDRGGGTFFYRWSDKPEELESWSEPEKLGPADSYPALSIDAENTLHLVNRECGLTENERWQLWYRRKRVGEPWDVPRRLVVSPTKGYCHFGHSLNLGPSGALHLLFKFHHGPTGKNYDCKTYAVSYLRSDDAGTTWFSKDGLLKKYPSEMDEVGLIKHHLEGGVSSSNLIVDAEDNPTFIVNAPDQLFPVIWTTSEGKWVENEFKGEATSGDDFVPFQFPILDGGHLSSHKKAVSLATGPSPLRDPIGTISWNRDGTISQVVSANPDGKKTRWYDPSLELYHQTYSIDGVRLSSRRITEIDSSAAFWHPSLEWWDWQRKEIACAGGHWLLYTHGRNEGGIGGNNMNVLKTKIYLTKLKF